MRPCLASTCLASWGRGGLQFIITDVTLNVFTRLQQEKLNLSPRVAAAYKEVANYQDLLLYSPKKQVILGNLYFSDSTNHLCNS